MEQSTGPQAGVEVACLGETMVAFTSTGDGGSFRASVAGAESNVAMALARIGRRAQWLSRLGEDPLGTLIEDTVRGAGVEVDVTLDPDRSTGVLVRHRGGTRPVTTYHRTGSAAAALGPGDAARIGSPAWLHLTGITPALSPSADDLITRLFGTAQRISFDVNLRTALWPDRGTASRRLGELSRRADLVFVGDDEAEALFGTAEPRRLADQLAVDGWEGELVVKQGSMGATTVVGGVETFVPALDVPVVDVTGAGDAFAAGYLAAELSSWPIADRLRLGHWLASQVVSVGEDHLPPFEGEDPSPISREDLEQRWASG